MRIITSYLQSSRLLYSLVLCWFHILRNVVVSDIVFTGVFPIHAKGENSMQCGEINFERGIQRIEAMFLAIDQINANENILKNITIKPVFIDSCDQGNIAVESFVKKALQKIRGTFGQNCASSSALDQDVNDLYGGVIGAASSSVSTDLANLLRLFKVPQISYASTSVVLNDRIRFKYFTRTVPPDTQQVNAMVDLAVSEGWRSFSIVYSEGSYGESAFEVLRRKSDEDELCLLEHFKVNDHTNFTRIVKQLQDPRHRGTSVIILFCQIGHVRSFLESLPIGHNFTLLASDFWGNKRKFLDTDHLRAVADRALTFKLRSPVIKDFVDYFGKLSGINNKRNQWYKEYLESTICAAKSDTQKCAPRIIMFDDKVPYVMDAVYALANGLDEVYRERCPLQNGVCVAMKDSIGAHVMEKLYNLTYTSVFGRSMLNENGSANTGYEILLYQANKHVYRKVGIWNGTIFPLESLGSYLPSSCFRPCQTYEIKLRKVGYPDCCYDCIPCEISQYKIDDEKCGICGSNMRPNKTGNGCVAIPLRHLPHVWVIVVVVLAAIGIVVTMAVILVFYYHKETEVVSRSAPELTFPLLVGVVLLYSLIFVVVADQTEAFCGTRRFCTGFFFSICFSAVLTKSNRLSRVFNIATYDKRAPRFIDATSQLVIMFFLVIAEGGFAIFALVANPPTLLIKVDEDEKSALVTCDHPTLDKLIAFLYNMVLLSVCAFYAFRTRKIPDGFNEAKYLGFVTYTTILIWVCFLPVYLVEVTEDTKTIAFGISIFLSATSILVILFGPKLYIIILRPSRNKKRSVSARSFATSQSHSMENSEGYPRKMTTCSALTACSKKSFSEDS